MACSGSRHVGSALARIKGSYQAEERGCDGRRHAGTKGAGSQWAPIEEAGRAGHQEWGGGRKL
jgi:hypothetical protein